MVLSFANEGSRTRVGLRQLGFPTAGTRDAFARAWPDVLTLLEDRIST